MQNPRQEILAAAEALCGDRDKALHWYAHQRIADLNDLTPAELVARGRGAQVLKYIEMCEAGSAG